MMTGKEALIALANGEDVQFCDHMGVWHNAGIHTHAIGLFLNDCHEFRLKPHTISINGIEVPAPFKPKLDDVVYYLTTTKNEGYTWGHFHPSDAQMTQFGAWRTEEEIKQVVAALRSIFK